MRRLFAIVCAGQSPFARFFGKTKRPAKGSALPTRYNPACFTQTRLFVKSLKIALLHFHCRQSYGSSPQAHRPGTPAKASSAKLLFHPLNARRLRGRSSLLRLYQYSPHHNTLFKKKQLSGEK
jgi:hypothetical protein